MLIHFFVSLDAILSRARICVHKASEKGSNGSCLLSRTGEINENIQFSFGVKSFVFYPAF